MILTFCAPVLEVFLHFTIDHKIDNQCIKAGKKAQTEIFQKFLPFAPVGYLLGNDGVSMW
jgi:hypothetical protein